MKYVACDGWKPTLTFSNSFLEYFVALIFGSVLVKILPFLLILIIPAIDMAYVEIFNDIGVIFIFVFTVWLGTRMAKKKLIKKHEEGVRI